MANGHAELEANFLGFACWDNDTHGRGDHQMHDRAAQRLLAQHPWLGRHSLYTAVVCGEAEEVERRLEAGPELARKAGGPRGWTPLLYLCFARFTHARASANAERIALALLRRGADPNAGYAAGESQYTCLVGAAGGGEQDAPRQPQSEALYRVLLAHGAGPYDRQVLYNTHFRGDVNWWLELTHARTMATGREGDWRVPTWPMFDMGRYGNGAYFLFRCAVENRNLEVARWLLAHGARPVETPADAAFLRSPPAFTLAEFAELTGQAEMAALLLEHGAIDWRGAPLSPQRTAFVGDPGSAERPAYTSRRARQGAERLAELCVRGDRSGAQAEAREHPELLRAMKPWEVAAHLNHPRAMALLLELGGRVDTSDAHGATPLHFASFAGSLEAVEFLLAHGADVNAVERRYHATPFGWACYRERWEVARRLLPLTEDVWALAFHGYVERLGEVLRQKPELARQVRPAGVTYSGYTPLWWLAADDAAALAATELLLAAGADPRHRNPNGRVAADWARTLGLTAVVERLERAAGEGVG